MPSSQYQLDPNDPLLRWPPIGQPFAQAPAASGLQLVPPPNSQALPISPLRTGAAASASYPIPFIAPPPTSGGAAPIRGLGASLRGAQAIQSDLSAMPAPRIASLDMGAPALPAISAPIAPTVMPVRGMPSSPNGGDSQMYRDQNKLDYYNDSGDGISQIKNPLLRGVARTADILGSIFAPIRGIEQSIPGTNEHHNYLIGQARGAVLNDMAQQQAQLTSQDTAADLQSRTLANQSEPQKAADAHALATATRANLQSEADDRAPKPLSLQQMHANAVQAAINAGRDPSADPTVQHLANQIIGLQPGQNKTPEAPKTIQVEVGGKPHQMAWDAKTGKYDLDQGESGEKPPTVNVDAGLAGLDRETKQFGTPYQKALDASNAQLEKIADARSMINGNAESQGLGVPKVLTALVGGQGSGVRITQAELTAIAHARGITGDIEGTLNKWSGQGALTSQQQKQLTEILDDVKARLLQKQAIASGTLDSINGATTRDQIIQADKQARQRLSDLETGTNDMIKVQIPGQAPGQIHASQKAAFFAQYPNAKVVQ